MIHELGGSTRDSKARARSLRCIVWRAIAFKDVQKMTKGKCHLVPIGSAAELLCLRFDGAEED